MMKRMITILTLSTALYGCSQLGTDAERRARLADGNDGDIVVGVVWPFTDSNEGFREGVELAQSEINQAGGLDGRLIKLVMKDDHNSITKGKVVAQDFVDNPNLTAVIGHKSEGVAQVTSLMYEYANIVMLCPGNTSSALTRDGFKRIFRTLPSDAEFGAEMAKKVADTYEGNILLAYQNDDFGRSLANAFESKADDLRLKIKTRLAYDKGGVAAFERSIKEVQPSTVKVAVLGTRLQESLQVMRLLRENGLDLPIVSGVYVEHGDLGAAYKNHKDVTIASVYHPGRSTPNVSAFAEAFQEKFEMPATVWAAQGYDSLKLLAQAMKNAKSSVPGEVANALRAIETWSGTTGTHSFDELGQVEGKEVFFKKLSSKGFDLIKSAAAPPPTER